jgi:hypothetical protein
MEAGQPYNVTYVEGITDIAQPTEGNDSAARRANHRVVEELND